MPAGEFSAMSSRVPRRWPFAIRQCAKCSREAVVIVASDGPSCPIASCAEHLEWAFFSGLDEWAGRPRAA